MAIEKVRKYFREKGIEDRIVEFDVSSETVELAAKAVGCGPEQIVKTLSFMVDDRPILIAVAGDARISNPKYREKFKTKARMIPFEEVDKHIGHEVGGVCPFAVNDGVEIFLDISIKRFDIVYPAAGSGNSAIGLSVEEMEKYSDAREWIDVCKDWNQS